MYKWGSPCSLGCRLYRRTSPGWWQLGLRGRTWQLAGTSGGALALLVLIAISAVVSHEPTTYQNVCFWYVDSPGRRHPCAHGAAPLSARCPAAAGCYQRVSSSSRSTELDSRHSSWQQRQQRGVRTAAAVGSMRLLRYCYFRGRLRGVSLARPKVRCSGCGR